MDPPIPVACPATQGHHRRRIVQVQPEQPLDRGRADADLPSPASALGAAGPSLTESSGNEPRLPSGGRSASTASRLGGRHKLGHHDMRERIGCNRRGGQLGVIKFDHETRRVIAGLAAKPRSGRAGRPASIPRVWAAPDAGQHQGGRSAPATPTGPATTPVHRRRPAGRRRWRRWCRCRRPAPTVWISAVSAAVPAARWKNAFCKAISTQPIWC